MEAKDENDKLVLSEAPKEIINPSHIHPFKLDPSVSSYEYSFSPICRLCVKRCPGSYFCGACDFHLCPTCVNKNPLSIDPGKTHEHPLSFVPKFSFVFTCDACGVGDERSSLCMCIPCSFAIHLGCVRLPRVICINRHEHRISLRLPLGSSGHRPCRVCRKKVNGEYGAYSCLTCSDYVVHSQCATTGFSVWDGIELDGVPEEDPAEIMPFVVIEEGVIKHFGHEHNLRLKEGDTLLSFATSERSKQCYACILPIYSDPYYICTHDCDFILHEVCANFMKKKRHPARSRRFTLHNSQVSPQDLCECCERSITGFYYEIDNVKIHALCASFEDGYVHPSHPHSELVILERKRSTVCSNCKRTDEKLHIGYYMMGCIECEDFRLCYRCITLPKVVEHKYDKHPLSLFYGESFKDGYWCDLCEKSLDPTKWYYTCREGNSTLHTHCVLGEDPSFRIGYTQGMDFDQVVHNNNVTRPFCHVCSSRCPGPSLFKFRDLSFCSWECMSCVWPCWGCNEIITGECDFYLGGSEIYSCPYCNGLFGK